MQAIEWCHFRWPWVTPDPGFKVTVVLKGLQPHCSYVNRANFSQASRGFVSDSWAFLFGHLDVIKQEKYGLELWKLFGLEPVGLSIMRGRLRRFGDVERKDDADWVKRCMLIETEGTRQRGWGCPNIYWDWVRRDMESFGLSREHAEVKGHWRLRIRGETGSHGFTWKWP